MPSIEIIFNSFIALILFGYWVMTLVLLYHLIRFGVGVQPKRFTVLFLFGSLALSTIVLFFALSINLSAIKLT